MIEDEKIIELFFCRSEQAITELDIKYGKLCHKLSHNILNNWQDAEECVNDAYLGAWNTIPPTKPNPLQSYICNRAWKTEQAKKVMKNDEYVLDKLQLE